VGGGDGSGVGGASVGGRSVGGDSVGGRGMGSDVGGGVGSGVGGDAVGGDSVGGRSVVAMLGDGVVGSEEVSPGALVGLALGASTPTVVFEVLSPRISISATATPTPIRTNRTAEQPRTYNLRNSRRLLRSSSAGVARTNGPGSSSETTCALTKTVLLLE